MTNKIKLSSIRYSTIYRFIILLDMVIETSVWIIGKLLFFKYIIITDRISEINIDKYFKTFLFFLFYNYYN
jgi:hypothetical protein